MSAVHVVSRLRHRFVDDSGTITVLLIGVLVVILMVMAMGGAVTGVHLERNGLQHAADTAALAASQALTPEGIYDDQVNSAVSPTQARQIAAEHLAEYPFGERRLHDVSIDSFEVASDGTVRLTVSAGTHPPLLGWFLQGAGISIPLQVTGQARAS